MRKSVIIIFAIAFIQLVSAAQDVSASISSSEGYVGLPLDFQISVTGTKKADVPELTGFDGFDVVYKGEQQYTQRSNINGVKTNTVKVTFSWELIPLREGLLTIPSISLELEGTSYQTPKGQVIISPLREVEGFKLVLSPEDDKVYMGQILRVNMEFYVSSEVGGMQFTLPGKGAGDREGEDYHILDSMPPDQNSSNVRAISIGDRVFYGYVTSRYEGGKQYTILSVPLDIIPLREGAIAIEGATVAFNTQQGSWPRTVSVNNVIPSEPCTVQGKSLPLEISNSPNGILLAQGELKAEASLSAVEARPGDPLTLQILLSGLARPDLCDIPDLTDFTDLEEEFSLPSDRSRPKADGDNLTITQTVRPVGVDTVGIPPLEFVYFDLESEEVRRVSTSFIPLAMSSAGDLPLSDVESFLGDSEAPALRENDRGIRQNKSIDLLMSGDRRGSVLISSFSYGIALLLPIILFLLYLLALFAGSFFRRVREKRDKNSFRQLGLSLGEGGDSFGSFEIYLRSRLFRGKSFSREELRLKEEELGMSGLADFYDRLEQGRYGGVEGEIDRAAVRETARELEGKL